MDAKSILDKAAQLTTRQDINSNPDNRTLLLLFLNLSRKTLLQNNEIPTMEQYMKNVTFTAGTVSLSTLKIKAVKTVFYKATTEDKKLHKVDAREDAVRHYGDITQSGEPHLYFIEGRNLIIAPIPATGTFNLVAEVWPDDLTDSVSSTDVTTEEFPEVLMYLAASTYLRHMSDPEADNLFQVGMTLFKEYLDDSAKNAGYDVYRGVRGYF